MEEFISEKEHKQWIYKNLCDVLFSQHAINHRLFGVPYFYGVKNFVNEQFVNEELENISLDKLALIAKDMFLTHIKTHMLDLYVFLTKNEYSLDFRRYYSNLDIMSEHLTTLFITNDFVNLEKFWDNANSVITQMKADEREAYLKFWDSEQQRIK